MAGKRHDGGPPRRWCPGTAQPAVDVSSNRSAGTCPVCGERVDIYPPTGTVQVHKRKPST